ncbi:neprilysin-4 [Trichonephila clavipes]|nr:neprilysin-4 [Trichonephila clavipes]
MAMDETWKTSLHTRYKGTIKTIDWKGSKEGEDRSICRQGHGIVFWGCAWDKLFSTCDALAAPGVYPASSPLGAKEVSGADRERIFEAYHKLLIETLRLLGVPEVRVQADSFDIIGFELQFSMITNTSQQCLLQSNKDANETREDDTRLYNVTVDDLEYHIPQIKWSRLMSYVFRNLGLPLDTSSLYVMVHCKEYFKQLGTLLSNTPPRTLANYMSWKFVLSYMSFMSMPFRQIFQDYTLLTPELKHSKLKTYTSRWKGCVSLVGSWFGNAIAAYYARHGYPRDVEQKAKQIVSSLKSTFIDIVSNTAWLDEESKNATIEKKIVMDCDDVQLLLYSQNQELTINEPIEMLEKEQGMEERIVIRRSSIRRSNGSREFDRRPQFN